MTTYHYDQFSADNVGLTFVSSSEPDTIGVAFDFEKNGLFEMEMDETGKITILFDEIENAEFLLVDFRELIDRGERELTAWHARLSEPGGMWAKE